MHELGGLVVAGMLSITFRRGFKGPPQTRFERPGNRFNRFNRFNRCELKRAEAGGLPASGTSAKRSTTAKSAKTAIFAMAAIMTILPLSLPGQAANANPTALIETSFGKIELELLPKFAPKHVAQFLNLINAGFYDGLTFHRVINGVHVPVRLPALEGPKVAARRHGRTGAGQARRAPLSLTARP